MGRSSKRYCYGGHICDVPLPHVRKYPGDEPRVVSAKLTSWVGYAPGASHWFASLEEEHNYHWRRKQSWKQTTKKKKQWM